MKRVLSSWIVVIGLGAVADARQDSSTVRMMLLGDVNLGRKVGQAILKGDTLYPFVNARERLEAVDLVFANLESQLTDQGGETQHPRDNLIFCGPPAGAWTLGRSGLDIVSTANNHAFDYGFKGLHETITALNDAGVALAGTSGAAVRAFPPATIARNGIRFGFLAYTEFVNIKGNWSDHIAVYDSARAADDVQHLRQNVDIVIASYHGGAEYVTRPRSRTLRNLRALASAGADIVVGHHPHVPQGVERRGTSVILYSLGNFVFYQPQHYWTQIGLAAEVTVVKRGDSTRVLEILLHPVAAGLQPGWHISAGALDSLDRRFQSTTSHSVRRDADIFRVDVAN